MKLHLFFVLATLIFSILLIGTITAKTSIADSPETVQISQTTTGSTARVSVASDDTQGNNISWGSAFSADGRYIAFYSKASNLVPGDTNGVYDVFVHDRQTGETSRVSVASNGTQGNNFSASPSISADGRYVAFESEASNLVSDDTNGTRDVFVHDRQTGQTIRASVASDGTEGNSASFINSISADGRYIAMGSFATNFVLSDSNNQPDIFVYDRQTGTITRISVASDGTEGNGRSDRGHLSTDGRYVIFDSEASNLVPDDTNNIRDVFLHDQQTGQTTLVSIAADGTQGNAGSYPGPISVGNRYIGFSSMASNFFPDDTNNAYDSFIYDRQTSEISHISVASDGSNGNGNSGAPTFLSDIRYVVFSSSADNLVPNDTNGRRDVFVYDRQTWETNRVSIVAFDGAEVNGDTLSWSISSDGRYIAFDSNASNLVAGDTNGVYDVFVHDMEGVLIPVAITDLVANTGGGLGQVDLTWTAPTGILSSMTYTVRYADSAIMTELGWQSATDVTGEPTPQSVGSAENMTISGLTPGQTYYFAVRVEYEIGSLSALSNSPSATGGNAPDLLFRPNPNGYQFANEKLKRTWNMFEQYFGSANVTMSNGNRCIAANKFFEEKYKSIANEWSCLGFSSTSLLSYLDRSQPKAGSFAIPHFEQLFQELETTQLANPIAYYSGVQAAQQWADGWNSWKSTCATDTGEMVEIIRRGIQNSEEVVISLNSSTSLGWHTLAPYRIDDVSETAIDIYVYDSEAPGQERTIHFSNSGGIWQWQYTFVGSMSPAGTVTGTCTAMYPYTLQSGLEQGTPPINWCAQSTNRVLPMDASEAISVSGKILAHLPANGDWIIKDNQERRLGWVNGELVSEIPDAYYVPTIRGDGLSYRTLYLPTADYTVEISNSLTTTLEYTLFGDGRFVGVSGELQSPGSSAQLSANSTLSSTTISGLENFSSFNLSIDNESAIDSRLVAVVGITTTGIENLDVSFDGEQVVVSRAGGNLQYTLGLENDEGDIFSSKQLDLQANDTHTLNPASWSNLGTTEVILEIDHNSDGSVDETETLSNQESGNKIYLPLIIK